MYGKRFLVFEILQELNVKFNLLGGVVVCDLENRFETVVLVYTCCVFAYICLVFKLAYR
jgi:hypothetical protein